MHLEKVACSVTHHLVDEVSREFPDQLRSRQGDLLLYETLHFLGFDVKLNNYNKNVSVHPNTLIRSSLDKEKCYKTLVYKGRVRKAIKEVRHGEIIYYKHKMHDLMDEYNTYEVLQPQDLSKYVSADEFMNVNDFGGKSTSEECL